MSNHVNRASNHSDHAFQAQQPPEIAEEDEVEADVELSALVNYIQPVHFRGFEAAEG